MKNSAPLLPRALAAVAVAALVTNPVFAQSAAPQEAPSPSAELAVPAPIEAGPSNPAPVETTAPADVQAAPAELDSAVAAPAAAIAPEPAAGKQASYAELPNFHRVDDKLYRGGQPREGGLARLKSLGVQTILDLRYERGKGRVEAAEAKALGMNYVQIPMYGLLRPTHAQIEKALEVIRDPANGPVFVHCERGSDRTGVVVGVYRVASAQWPAQRAIDEAMGHGMYKAEWAKRSYIRYYSQRAAGQTAAGSQTAASSSTAGGR